MNIENIVHILRARQRWVLGTTIIVVLLAAVAVGFVPRKYTALASVVVNTRGDDPLRGPAASSTSSGPNLATQVDIIKRPRVALRVVKDLDLASKPGLRSAWTEQTGGRGDFASWIAQAIAGGLSASPGGDSNVIDIKYTSRDATEAATYANAFTDAYLETALELRTTPARQFTTFFDDRRAELRQRMEDAQTRLSRFGTSNNLVDAAGKADVENARLSELSTQLAMSQSLLADSTSRQSGASRNVAASPEVMANGVVQQLKGQVAAQEVKVGNLANSLGPNHPEFKRAQADLIELKSRLNAESAQVGASLVTASRVSEQRVAELRSALDTQRQRVLAIGQLKDQAQLLQRDVDTAQRDYDLVTQRQAQSSLESQVQQSDVALLDRAVVPLSHAWPNVPLTLLLALFSGLLLGSVLALTKEYLNPVVRTSRDLIALTSLPILTVIPGAARLGSSRRRLLAPPAHLPAYPAR